MDRIYASGAAGTPPSVPASPSSGYPTAGNPGAGTPATKPGPYWYHMITEELMQVIIAAGITPAPGTLTQLKQALDALYGSMNVYRKNAIINGNFDVWQRNTSFAIATAGSNYTADRWLANIGTTGNNSTVSRQAFTVGQGVVPNEPTYWLRYAVTAFVSGVPSLGQRIESVRTFAGKQVTVSFWAKADAARTVSCSLNQVFGSGGAPSAGVNSAVGTFNLTTAWQKFSGTVTLPSISGKTLGTNGDDYLQALFVLPGAVCTIDIAQVQVEAGSSATAFDLLPPQQVIALCQRYYEKSYDTNTVPGTATSIGMITMTIGANNTLYKRISGKFAVQKRVTPSFHLYDAAGSIDRYTVFDQAGGATNGQSVVGNYYIGTNGFLAETNSTLSCAGVTMHWTADAEL